MRSAQVFKNRKRCARCRCAHRKVNLHSVRDDMCSCSRRQRRRRRRHRRRRRSTLSRSLSDNTYANAFAYFTHTHTHTPMNDYFMTNIIVRKQQKHDAHSVWLRAQFCHPHALILAMPTGHIWRSLPSTSLSPPNHIFILPPNPSWTIVVSRQHCEPNKYFNPLKFRVAVTMLSHPTPPRRRQLCIRHCYRQQRRTCNEM